MTRQEMLDLIADWQDRFEGAWEALGPDADVTADLGENIRRLRDERDELLGKINLLELVLTRIHETATPHIVTYTDGGKAP